MGKWKIFYTADTGISEGGSDLMNQAAAAVGSEGNQSAAGSQENKPEEAGNNGETGTLEPSNEKMTWLPKDLRDKPSLAKFADGKPADLAKSYVELESKVGQMTSIPGEDATPEEVAAFFNKLGRPEGQDGYQLTFKDGIAENIKTGLQKSEGSLRKALHEAGASQKMAEAVFSWLQDETVIGTDAITSTLKQQRETAEASLKKEWGGLYDNNLRVMGTALKQFGGDDLMKYLSETGLGNHPAMIKAWYNIGKNMQEDTIVNGDPHQDESGRFVYD